MAHIQHQGWTISNLLLLYVPNESRWIEQLADDPNQILDS